MLNTSQNGLGGEEALSYLIQALESQKDVQPDALGKLEEKMKLIYTEIQNTLKKNSMASQQYYTEQVSQDAAFGDPAQQLVNQVKRDHLLANNSSRIISVSDHEQSQQQLVEVKRKLLNVS